MLGSTIRNLQVSWVKDGMRQAQWLLSCGANDFGGTLINESISTSAGATHGQLQTPSALRRAIRDAGRVPVERSTRYEVLRTFPREPGPDERDPLDGVERSRGDLRELRPARARRALQVPAAGRGAVSCLVIGGHVHVEGDALAVDDDRAQAGRARGRAVGGEAVGAAEARGHRRGRGDGERVGVVTEVIVHEGDVVVVEGREQAADVGGLDAGQVGHEDHRRRRAP